MNSRSIESKKRFLGIYEKAINAKFTWAQKIKIAKKVGFDFIEFSIDESDAKLARLEWSDQKIHNLKQLLDQEKFYFNSMTLSAHRKYPFGSKDPQVRKKALKIMEQAIILAKKLGIRIVQVATYDEYYQPNDALTKKYFLEGMKKACLLAEKHSVLLAFETMDTFFAGTISRCLNLINQIASPYLFVYPDLGNLSQFSNDVATEIELGKAKIVAFHFKETAPNQFRNLTFGTGTVDFVKILKVIQAHQIYVPMMIEMWSENDPAETMSQNIAKLAAAKTFYEQQWQLVGEDVQQKGN